MLHLKSWPDIFNHDRGPVDCAVSRLDNGNHGDDNASLPDPLGFVKKHHKQHALGDQ